MLGVTMLAGFLGVTFTGRKWRWILINVDSNFRGRELMDFGRPMVGKYELCPVY
jgi:hypothetical protein